MSTFNQLSESYNKDTIKHSKNGISIKSSHMKWHLRDENMLTQMSQSFADDTLQEEAIERHDNLD